MFQNKSSITNDNNQIIPRKVSFGNPDKMRVSLTHDGKYILYVAPKDGVLNIWLAPSDDISKAEAITDDKDRGISSYMIAHNNKNVIYSQDYKGDENFRLYSYNIETKETKLLYMDLPVQCKKKIMSIVQKTNAAMYPAYS